MLKRIIRREAHVVLDDVSNLDPLLKRIYTMRDIDGSEDLNRELNSLLPFNTLVDIEKAAKRLADALEKQEHILIVGDFDTDGATSSALAVSVLQAFGAQHVSYLVPNRFTYGYGLTPGIVDEAATKKPNLIVTVDNGVASHDGVLRAKEHDIEVIVTDHHLPPDTLPDAYAIVNPNRKDDLFPSKCLAGVGVIFYVMLALRHELKEKNWFETHNISCPNMGSFLDLVALGTVADMVPLDKNNRILVHQGVKRMRAGALRPGIQALMDVAGRDYKKMRASECGFVLGPRLNAAGRLDDMSLGISCLLAPNLGKAKGLAKQLEDLNHERRGIEAQMQKEAFDIVDALNLTKKLPAGLCLHDKKWHQGVVGLVASRVKDRVHRPVIAFALSDDGMLKGSARSIKGMHIRDALDNIATQNPEVLSKFGGHAMAAGLTIKVEHLKQFTKLFAEEVTRHLKEEDLCGVIESDGELNEEHFNLPVAEKLREAGPWGQGFPEPLFDGRFRLYDQRIVGQKHLKVLVRVPESDTYLEGIAFNVDLDKWPNSRCESAQLAYRLDINEYNGRKKLQLIIEDLLEPA